MHYGPLLTYLDTAAELERYAQAARGGPMPGTAHTDPVLVKVVGGEPGWGLPGGWTDGAILAVLVTAGTVIVRSLDGDPSYGRSATHPWGLHPYPTADRVVAGFRRWYDLWQRIGRPCRLVFEIGNEPLLDPLPGFAPFSEIFAWDYRSHLEAALVACRAAFPGVLLLGPAQIENHHIRCGSHAHGQEWMTEICADVLRRFDGLSIHAYTVSQLANAIERQRRLVSKTLPIWLTECNLNEPLSDALRGAMLAQLLRGANLAGVAFYHAHAGTGSDPAHFNPHYNLSPATLESFGRAWRAAPAPTPVATPAPAPTPAPPPASAPMPTPPRRPAPVTPRPFAADIRHWPTVEAFAAHLAAHDPAICRWVRGITLHHTYKPTLADWQGRASVDGLLRYYRDHAPWTDAQGNRRRGWSAGPHLFLGPDGIWQLTPLNLRGIHAVSFNATHWGFEVVGFYDRAPWSAEMRALVEGTVTAGLRWLRLPASTINGHRDDPTTDKTCPGRAIDLNVVRANVARRLSEAH